MPRLDPAWKGNYGWSSSSDRLWNSCKRAFFYRYVANWQSAVEHPPADRIRRLKALTGLRMLEGRLTHEAIENAIQQHRLGREIKLGPLLFFYESHMRPFLESTAEEVTEAFNGLRVQEDFLNFVLEDGKRQLETFVRVVWPQLVDLQYLEHEEFENFYIDDLKVNVKVDYVSRSRDGTIVVTDWKTGREYVPAEDDIQLAVYGLWASSKYEVPLERVKLELAFLRTGRSIPVELTTDVVREVKEAVLASSAEVLAVDFLEDFPTAPTPEKCISCPFATICPDGDAILQEFRAQEMLDAVEGSPSGSTG